ncbi:MAG: class I SAM-dependent methyltransferase [Thermodesulfobacteriota bacterium]
MNPANALRKLKLYASMVAYGNAHNRDFAREHWDFFARMDDFLAPYGGLAGKRVLDVGCGKAAWLTLLCAGAGAIATGIDTEVVEPGFRFSKYAGILRKNGPERFARTLAWELLYARPYFRELAAQADFVLPFSKVDARPVSVTELPFDDDTFDYAVSHEVLEHLPDLEAAADEIARVVKPQGLTYLYVHNFASISGGHHIAWKYPDTEPSDSVPPWDHLRENRFPDIPSWINRVREKDFRAIFEHRFHILAWLPTHEEGTSLLTPEIMAELPDFSRQELLTKGFIIVGRPKKKKH